MRHSRRAVLSLGAGTITTAAAGCLSEVTRGDSTGGYAAFFTLQDWANAVGGDAISFETPVDVGDTGHGWSPSSDLIAELATSRAFVYLDSPAFAWAQDAAEVLERDYDDVAVIDALDGVDLLEADREITHGSGGRDGADHEDEDHDHDGNEHEREDDHDDHQHGDEHEHDHGRYDPHVWLDPGRARTMIETIAAGLGAIEPDGEGTVADNASAYAARLDDLDRRFRDVVASDDRPVGVLASHDSFRYLQDRYGFELHAPTGISPDESPSQSAIAETIDFVDAHGIDTVLYDRFEADRLARTIVENSAASAAEAVTPAAGTTEAWIDEGWGYIEQMAEVNVPALEAGLVSRD